MFVCLFWFLFLAFFSEKQLTWPIESCLFFRTLNRIIFQCDKPFERPLSWHRPKKFRSNMQNRDYQNTFAACVESVKQLIFMIHSICMHEYEYIEFLFALLLHSRPILLLYCGKHEWQMLSSISSLGLCLVIEFHNQKKMLFQERTHTNASGVFREKLTFLDGNFWVDFWKISIKKTTNQLSYQSNSTKKSIRI